MRENAKECSFDDTNKLKRTNLLTRNASANGCFEQIVFNEENLFRSGFNTCFAWMRYVFEGKTIMQYLESKDYYSEYVRLLSEVPVSSYSQTTLKQLLAARGHYTVFAPTNDAVQDYLDSLCKKGIITEASWDGFQEQTTLDSIKKVIVFNSVLDSGDQYAFDVSDFPDHEHEFGLANMNNRKLRVFYGQNDLDSISIDNVAVVSKTNRGIVLTNGYVHQVESVVAPNDGRLGDFMRLWAKNLPAPHLTSAHIHCNNPCFPSTA